MAIGIDTTNWKPRKIKGTPAAKFSSTLAVGLIGVGVLCGAFYQLSGLTSKFRTALDSFYEDPIEEVERKQLIASGLPVRTGDQIRKLEEEYSQPNRADK